jgi:hypothetical protein
VQLLVLEVAEVLGRAGGLPSGPILSGLSRTVKTVASSVYLSHQQRETTRQLQKLLAKGEDQATEKAVGHGRRPGNSVSCRQRETLCDSVSCWPRETTRQKRKLLVNGERESRAQQSSSPGWEKAP